MSPTGSSQRYSYIAQRYDTLYRAIEVCIELCSMYNENALDITWMHYAGINLTGYHPPGHPGAFAQQKMPGGGPKNDDVPGAGHLHQLAFKHGNC